MNLLADRWCVWIHQPAVVCKATHINFCTKETAQVFLGTAICRLHAEVKYKDTEQTPCCRQELLMVPLADAEVDVAIECWILSMSKWQS